MEVPPPILAVFLPCRLPWFFVFLLSDRFVPFVLMALGHHTALLGPPKYKKNGIFPVTDQRLCHADEPQ